MLDNFDRIATNSSSRLTRPWGRMQWERAYCPLLALSLETIAVAKSLFDVSRHFSPRPPPPAREIQFSLSFLSEERDWISWRNRSLCIFTENQVNYMRYTLRHAHAHRWHQVFSHARSVYLFLRVSSRDFSFLSREIPIIMAIWN